MILKTTSEYHGRMTRVTLEMSREEFKSLVWAAEVAEDKFPNDGASKLLAEELIPLRADLALEEF